jgi:hypothetical protein
VESGINSGSWLMSLVLSSVSKCFTEGRLFHQQKMRRAIMATKPTDPTVIPMIAPVSNPGDGVLSGVWFGTLDCVIGVSVDNNVSVTVDNNVSVTLGNNVSVTLDNNVSVTLGNNVSVTVGRNVSVTLRNNGSETVRLADRLRVKTAVFGLDTVIVLRDETRRDFEATFVKVRTRLELGSGD